MVTPSGGTGSYFNQALRELFRQSSWITIARCTSEAGVRHLHFLIALPRRIALKLRIFPKITRKGRRLPVMQFGPRSAADACYLSFSKIFNIQGISNYLNGYKNRAEYVFTWFSQKKFSVTVSTHAESDQPGAVRARLTNLLTSIVKNVLASKPKSLHGQYRQFKKNQGRRTADSGPEQPVGYI